MRSPFQALWGSIIYEYRVLRGVITSYSIHYTKLYEYLEEVEQYSGNYIGTILKNIKTVCNDAKLNGIETHTQLSYIKGYTVDTEIVFLSFQELELIENTEYSRDALANAKDWLIIGCYIGQRVSSYDFV